MRYSSYKADFIGKGDYDFRCFKTLDQAQSSLIFSTLRSIETSYRNAVSAYLGEASRSNRLIQDLNGEFDKKEVNKYFFDNLNYYYDLSKSEIFETILNSDSLKYFELSESELENVVKIFRGFNNCKELSKFIKGFDSSIVKYALLAEYYSFKHLKKFIPDASQFFMDAVLSEPPISQGQRRRILFALDILLEGFVYVADEPLANLDFESSIPMLDEMMSYVDDTDSSILLLDQQLNKKVVNYIKMKSYLGNIFKFCDSQSYNLKIIRER